MNERPPPTGSEGGDAIGMSSPTGRDPERRLQPRSGRRHKRAKRLSVDTPEINLVPMLDMISLLVQMLLLNAHFGALAELRAQAAAAAVQDAGPKLLLEVQISPRGYEVAWSEGPERVQRHVDCKAPCEKATDWDAAALTSLLSGVKRAHPDEQTVVVRPGGPVGFELIALTMDAVSTDANEKPMFPDVALGGE